jgi:hypothetical protein
MSVESKPDDDVILKLARLGAWAATWIGQEQAPPDRGAIELSLTRYHLATLNPAGPGVVLTDAAARTLPALVNADDCHP